MVGVSVGVCVPVGVAVGMFVGVAVGVSVAIGVSVGVFVAMSVGVAVGVSVGGMAKVTEPDVELPSTDWPLVSPKLGSGSVLKLTFDTVFVVGTHTTLKVKVTIGPVGSSTRGRSRSKIAMSISPIVSVES